MFPKASAVCVVLCLMSGLAVPASAEVRVSMGSKSREAVYAEIRAKGTSEFVDTEVIFLNTRNRKLLAALEDYIVARHNELAKEGLYKLDTMIFHYEDGGNPSLEIVLNRQDRFIFLNREQNSGVNGYEPAISAYAAGFQNVLLAQCRREVEALADGYRRYEERLNEILRIGPGVIAETRDQIAREGGNPKLEAKVLEAEQLLAEHRTNLEVIRRKEQALQHMAGLLSKQTPDTFSEGPVFLHILKKFWDTPNRGDMEISLEHLKRIDADPAVF
ncbi:hypothetical protein [Pacificispira sp.]|uniref:hypothetical protein n=1 Tax=Pacificispira sp. TaxID=2888761 RepID=UPI003BA9F0E1